jgi:hypothetical protein
MVYGLNEPLDVVSATRLSLALGLNGIASGSSEAWINGLQNPGISLLLDSVPVFLSKPKIL